jgi:hypothetical protein
LWSDNEFTDVSRQLNKCYYENTVIFKHEHPANTKLAKADNLYNRNDKFYRQDQLTYEKRKQNNFSLPVVLSPSVAAAAAASAVSIKKNLDIPIIITNRNLLTWPKKMVQKLKTLELVKRIFIVDNASNYEPLLNWYSTLTDDPIVKVIRLNMNLGHLSPWKCEDLKHIISTELYVVTDPDLNIDNLPSDILKTLINKLRHNKNLLKVGLKLDVGPDFSKDCIVYQHIQDWEKKRWSTAKIADDVGLNIQIDTTFALYTVGKYFIGGGSYVHHAVIHEPWNFTRSSLENDKEFLYYIFTSNNSSSFKKFVDKHSPTLEKQIFDTAAYSDHYPDLKNAFGNDGEKLFSHWKRHGVSENRKFFLK